ncbi:hypothetical protein UNSWDHB_1117 [Dehalobacter sp. UNSWDHB]|jgi:Predicted membrane protein (DUF2232).|uniref:DUF2232 domain-containing protein n=1 Tax=unclassified Dehalobacter TaxID=2635733 RepID=UPI00028A82F3|nr:MULTISPECIES: DUF2232 domain-containing protein [unclassified Dehalobacter]AFV03986.1 hypothetical protein DHBDCA_p2959 [Dehalobacter sp. DCA]AFV06966.1 hypothetical protein DCF50_p2963 [Dehalobacter sp. CF]EQB21568.1 hypothetical protein UNSWDHB_1117 [Dehalobacter sp. UNSWDHB]
MVISDKDALRYVSGLIVLFLPLLASLFDFWSWIVEVLLIVSVLFQTRSTGCRKTAIFLGIGYILAFIPVGISGISLIGFTPWAGILLVIIKEKGFSTSQSIFWSLLLAALIGALPVIPSVNQALQPENLEKNIVTVLQFYEQQGLFSAFQEQGISIEQFESTLRTMVPVYYQLMPAFAGIFAMLEVGLVYLFFRIFSFGNKLKPFSLWRMPWYAVWLAIIGIAAYLGGDYFANSILRITGMNVMTVAASITSIIGLSCLAYLIKSLKFSHLLIWIIVIIVAFVSPFFFICLIFTGLFDLVFNFRKIPEKMEEQKP